MAKTISSLSVVLGATVKPFVSAFAGVRSIVSGFTSSIAGAGGSILKFTGLAGLASAAWAAFKSAGQGISLAAELEQTEVAFSTMLGSASAAQAMMGNLKKLAADTPFEFPGIASSAKALVAFGVAANDIPNTLTMIGDVASGVGVSVKELSTIYGKAKVAGRLYAQDVNELTGRGIPIIQELAKQFGVSESEVKKLVEQGKVGFPQLQKAFQSLTGEGGKFHGMMAAQSQTLAGLWSTLSDTIGMTLADLTTTIVKAFNLKGVMKSLTAWLSSVGGALNSFVTTYAPLIVGWLGSLWSSITAYGSAIYAYVAPVVFQIYGVIAANWQGILSSTVSMLTGAYNFISAIFNAALSLAGIIWGGIVSVWQWGCDLVGYKTQQTGSGVGNAFQGIIDAGNWMRETVGQTLALLAFGINNFGQIVQYVGTSAAFYIVEFYNQTEWALGAAWEYFKWFGTNLPSILLDASINSQTVFRNLLGNIVSVIGNLPGLISGSTSLSDVWSPLTDGMRNTTSELPKIAARIPGDLEAALAAESTSLGDGLVDGAIAALNDLDKQAAGATGGMGATVKAIGDQFSAAETAAWMDAGWALLPDPKTEGIATATQAMDGLAASTDKAAKSWETLMSGTAEAQHASAIAGFQSSIAPLVAATAGGASASAGPSISPLPKQAIQQLARGSSQGGAGKDSLVEIARAILAKMDGMGIELSESA